MNRITFVAIALALAPACTPVEGKVDAPARPVRVTAAADAAPAPALRFSAAIQAEREVTVAFKTSGYVDVISHRLGADGRMRPLQAGDRVAAGELLARLREADHLERLNQADGSLKEVEAAHAKSLLDLDRARALFESRSLTKPELDAAQAAFDAASAQRAAAHAGAALARISLADASIRAPESGVIVGRRIESGALVTPGSPAFVIARIDPVKAVIGVPDLHLGRVAPGRRLRIFSEAMPGETFEGTVTSVSPAADDQNRLFAVDVTLANADRRWRPGMIASVELGDAAAAAPAVGGMAIPISAIVRSGGGYGVFVIDDDDGGPVARARPVELGEIRGNTVIVTSGLDRADTVVTSGPALLVDGERVRVVR